MEAKVNGEKGEQGEVTRQKEDSDGRRRRRGRLKHKEFVTGETTDISAKTPGLLCKGLCLNFHLTFSENGITAVMLTLIYICLGAS